MNQKRSYQDHMLPWHAWGCMAIAIMIPTFKKLVPGFIVLLGLYAIVHAFRNRSINKVIPFWPLMLMAILFLLHVVGFTQSENISAGMNELGIKASFLAFPVIAWLIPSFSENHFKKIALAFVTGCLAFIPVAIGYGIFRTAQTGDPAYLSYQDLGINYHPTYAATYQALSLFILFQQASVRHFIFRKRWLHLTSMGVTIIFISMLASKAGIVAGVISVFMGAILLIRNNMSVRESVATAIIAMSLLISSTLLIPGISSRVEAAVEDIENAQPAEGPAHIVVKSSTQLRLVTWKGAWEILQANPLGIGTGDTEKALEEKYLHAGETYAAQKKLNAHNQFLQSGAELGWAGILIVLSILLALFLLYLKTKEMMLLHFILICGMNFMFESFLEVQAGIVFFCFWVMIFSKKSRNSLSIT